MSEKLYAYLLRLFPSAFRGRYEEEALQLLRDRLSIERGFFLRLRLCLDLITDTIGALPRAYRNSYTDAAALALLTTHFSGVPSFRGLQKEPIRRGVIMMAVLLTMAVLATFFICDSSTLSPDRPECSQVPYRSCASASQSINGFLGHLFRSGIHNRRKSPPPDSTQGRKPGISDVRAQY
jgi:cation transport ATPase